MHKTSYLIFCIYFGRVSDDYVQPKTVPLKLNRFYFKPNDDDERIHHNKGGKCKEKYSPLFLVTPTR